MARRAVRRKKRSRPASPSSPQRYNPVVKMWLMDTGCGHDLITNSDAQQMKDFIRKASTAVNFNTAK
eukprot:5904549-Lingulodinium_polyedra.AAC.1